MKYIYCLVRHDPSIPGELPRGLKGTEVYCISFNEISALISDTDSDQLVGSVQNALMHEEVVDWALRLFKSVIPCRFGTLFSNDECILTFLQKHYARLDAYLAKLEGKIEVSVLVIFDRRGADMVSLSTVVESPKSDMTEGQRYLLKKKVEYDASRELNGKADLFSRELNQAMSPFWSDVKVMKKTTESALLLSLCYLVDQRKLPFLKSAYQKFGSDNPSLKSLYTGPWPPYSFADINFYTDED